MTLFTNCNTAAIFEELWWARWENPWPDVMLPLQRDKQQKLRWLAVLKN